MVYREANALDDRLRGDVVRCLYHGKDDRPYLEPEGSSIGNLYTAFKGSIAGKTEYEEKETIRARDSKSVRSAILLVKADSRLDFKYLDQICRATAEGRQFDLIVNNCQRYCNRNFSQAQE
ncbi:hypothetical protein AJ78_06491 [Emergomyces pasteurianus Ep9510]|uniref:Uncharacterized protein n=1 Tax=Emergomyces pasteurianus Ep9510 TaxID=1447872 RepID=A0A1J9PAB2_9EURO|nr:hypothetical protein AJ78_06491 [Emergomyces pasteurianus Ep9510]